MYCMDVGKKKRVGEKVNPKDKLGNEKGVLFSQHTLCLVQEIVCPPGNDKVLDSTTTLHHSFSLSNVFFFG